MSTNTMALGAILRRAAIGLCLLSVPALLSSASADTVRGCVQFACGNPASGSWPALQSGDTDWQPFDSAIATQNAGKRMAVRFLPSAGDNSAFPLQAGTSTVVRITDGTTPVTCTTPPPSPIPDLEQGSPAQCWYDFETGDIVRIYYQGVFAQGAPMQWEIQNLEVQGSHTFENFDSNDPKDPFTGVSLGVPAPSPSTSRPSARLLLVFDKSGSLDWNARPDDPACGSYTSPAFNCRRWNILEAAADQLVSVAEAYHLPGDQLGVVLFDSTATVVGGTFSPMDPTTLNGVGTTLSGTSPSGSTSMGAGVTAMQSDLEANNASFNNMILVFTDGEQNTAPYLRSSSNSLLINPTSPVDLGAEFPSSGNDWRTCVFWLRTDDPAAPEMTSLNERISENGCTLLESGTDPRNAVATIDASSTELVEFFLGILQATLIGDKLEFVHTSKGVLAGPGDGADVAFTGSDQDVALTVLINWPLGRENPRSIQLEKDGVLFDPLKLPGAEIRFGRSHLAITMRPPLCTDAGDCAEPGGEWRLTFENDGASQPYAYGLFVMSDNRDLASAFRVDQPTAGVGEPLEFEAVLTEDGTPLTGLADGSVRAIVFGPDAGLGNVLSEAKIDPASIDSNDQISPSGLKTLAMRADPDLAAQLAAALGVGSGQMVTLSERDPGIYAGSFGGTGAEGVYQIRFEVEGETTSNGAFVRVWTTDRYVAVVPDADATSIDTAAFDCDLVGQCFNLTLRPADGAGNLLGPGKTTLVTVNDFGGTILRGITDNLDGTYGLSVGYGTSERQPPVLSFDGAQIPFPPVESWNGALSGWDLKYGPYWWMILIAVLLGLLLVVFWLFRRGGA